MTFTAIVRTNGRTEHVDFWAHDLDDAYTVVREHVEDFAEVVDILPNFDREAV